MSYDLGKNMHEKKWYIVHVHSGFEETVKKSIDERVRLECLEDKFGNPEEIVEEWGVDYNTVAASFGKYGSFVPTEDVISVDKNGRKKIQKRKLFPSYVLINVSMNEQVRYMIRNIPRVLGFIGGNNVNEVFPVNKRDIDKIISKIRDSLDSPKHKTSFVVGESVRIIGGPFKDFTGSIEYVNYDQNRLQVIVQVFNRSTPVELDFKEVEKIN